MTIYLTISNSNDISLIILSSLITTIIMLIFIVLPFLRFIKKLQEDNENYRSKTIQQLNEKDNTTG